MGFRDNLRKVAFTLRRLPGEKFEIRPYRIFVVRETHPGKHPGDGPVTTVETEITEANGQPPKVRYMSEEERALGQLHSSTLELGPITPPFPGGGTSWDTLTGKSLAKGDTFYYKLIGPEYPNGARFRFIGGKSDRTFSYRIRVSPVSEKS